MKIKELEITKEMYLEVKRIENLYHLKDKFEVGSENFRKYNNEWVKADEEFQKNFCDEFDTLEIVNEYERREKNTDRLLTRETNTDRFLNVYRITHLRGAREFKFFSCYLDKKNKKLYTLTNNIYGNQIYDVFDASYIKNVECIERNNNLDYQ